MQAVEVVQECFDFHLCYHADVMNIASPDSGWVCSCPECITSKLTTVSSSDSFTSLIISANNNTTLLIKEALHLKLINRDEGVAISECWQLVLDHATMTSSTHATPRRETDDGTIDAA